MSIPEGVYNISKADSYFTLVHPAEEITPIVTLPIDPGHPEKSQWRVEKRSNGNFTIRNEAFDAVYFLVPLSKESGSLLIATREPFEWRMQPTAEKDVYHIVVPGGAIDGNELTADFAHERSFPPKIALQPLVVASAGQGWLMTKLD